MRQKLRFTGNLCQVTISKCAGKDDASVRIDTPDYNTQDARRPSAAMGVDMGIQELSDDLTRRFDTVVIEDRNVSGMVKNRRLARAIRDADFGALKHSLPYKAELRGCTVLKANRFYPSSRTCSACGAIHQEVELKDRDWKCAECGAAHD